jgi:Tfp pilus assembly protein PilZ
MFNALYQSDRRMHGRTACDLPTGLDDASGYVRNFGKGGALIETTGKSQAKVGQEIFMTIPFKGRPNDLILKARVAWTDGDSLGVTFQKE